jgi:hypothetical protein
MMLLWVGSSSVDEENMLSTFCWSDSKINLLLYREGRGRLRPIKSTEPSIDTKS